MTPSGNLLLWVHDLMSSIFGTPVKLGASDAPLNVKLLRCIPAGRDNAASLEELHGAVNLSKRTVRHEIERLRAAGIPVVSSSRHTGYWLATDIAEIKAYLAECDARERTQRKTTAKLREMVAEAEGKRVVQVRAHERRITARKEVDGQLTL